MSNGGPWDPQPGIANPHGSSGVRDRDVGPIERISRAVNGWYKNRSLRKHTGTWKGVCLHAKAEYYEEGYSGGYSLSATLKKPTTVISVIARIPELDYTKPCPSKFGDPNGLSEADKEALSMHRVFRTALGQTSHTQQIPAPGDIVELDFELGAPKFLGGIYLGILDKGVGTMPDRPVPGESGEAQDAFDSAGSDISTVEDY